MDPCGALCKVFATAYPQGKDLLWKGHQGRLWEHLLSVIEVEVPWKLCVSSAIPATEAFTTQGRVLCLLWVWEAELAGGKGCGEACLQENWRSTGRWLGSRRSRRP